MAFSSTPFFVWLLLAANHPAIPHIPIPIESHHIPSVVFPGFVTPGPVLLTSAVVRRLRSASIVFIAVSLLISSDYSPINLLFRSSPSPASRRPRGYKQHELHHKCSRQGQALPPALCREGASWRTDKLYRLSTQSRNLPRWQAMDETTQQRGSVPMPRTHHWPSVPRH